jgi:hypothetical protein
MNLKLLMIAFFFTLQTNAQEKMEQFDFLVGTWKMDGKNTYEHWTKDANVLVGESFKVKDDVKYVSETLRIEQVDNNVVYTATVMGQNEGKAIAFTLNLEVTDKLSFENTTHDFPKKIRYTKLTDTELFVEVLGDNDEGFSFKMQKQ